MLHEIAAYTWLDLFILAFKIVSAALLAYGCFIFIMTAFNYIVDKITANLKKK